MTEPGRFRHHLQDFVTVAPNFRNRKKNTGKIPMTVFPLQTPLLPDIIALHGKWRASDPALICEDRLVTWQAFAENQNRVAHGLLALGLKKGDRVAVVMSNSIEMVEILFGIFRAGCVAVPLNLAVSDDHMVRMIKDCGARALIVTADQASRFAALPHDLAPLRLCAGEVNENWIDYATWKENQPSDPPDIPLAPDDPINIIYSSGTTGTPKGIVHTQQGRLNFAQAISLALHYSGKIRTLVNIGLYSNISWVSMICTLLNGGTLIIQKKFDALDFLTAVQELRITHCSMVPVQFQQILELKGQEKFDLSSLRAVMSCGSPLHASLKEKLCARLSGSLIELYGLTEGISTTIEPEDGLLRPASVGKPNLSVDLKIIGPDGREMPPGEKGEIVGRSNFLMSGYFNRKDATEEATWTDEAGKKWLRTGDLGHLDEEGFLYLTGRLKDMILSGGQNIYPEDLETVLMQHDAISEAAVIGIKSRRWGETPLALVVLHKGKPVPAEDIREWCNARLGRQQKISMLKIVNHLPRNPNGKILKNILREKYGNITCD